MACCDDFTRAQRRRAAAGAGARAGQGLPAIEPGMPLPAGTGLTRRDVLVRSAGLALSVYGADRLGFEAFEAGIAEAAAAPAQPVLISIFLPGGIDSLSVLAPTGDPAYSATLRPTLRLDDAGTLEVSGRTDLRWHPGAAALKALHDAGKVSIAPAIGYASPNQSHFTSRHFWEVGALDVAGRTGWMGRYLDIVGQVNNPIQGLSLDSQLSPSLASTTVSVSAASSPASYTFTSPNVTTTAIKTGMLDAFGTLGGLPSADPVLAQARQAQANADGLRRQLATPVAVGSAAYPANNTLAGRLKSLAGLLDAGLPIRCVTVNANGGYDTHSGQATALSTNLTSTCAAIAAFQADLEARGAALADRVLIHLWSEFGRRPRENGSNGTDHGAAGASFVVGTRASGQAIGEFPGLTTLDSGGNLRSTSDFRAVYCSLLEQWLGVDAAAVIPGAAGFGRPVLVR